MRIRLRLFLPLLALVAVSAAVARLLWTGGVIRCGRGPFVRRDVQYIADQLERYKRSIGHYPTAEEGLRAVPKVPQDPWRKDYVYRIPGTRHPDGYDLFSAGPDRRPDTPDDYWGDE